MENILVLAEQQGIHSRHKLHMCVVTYGRQFWLTIRIPSHQKQHSGKNDLRVEKDRTPCVKNCAVHISENPLTYEGSGNNLSRSRLPQQKTTHRKGSLPISAEYLQAFHIGEGHYRCRGCGAAFSHKSKRLEVNLGKPMAQKPTFFSIRKFTLEKGFMHVLNVGKPLTEDPTMFGINNCTLQKGPMPATSVEKLIVPPVLKPSHI
jgi:hypothetical protein